MADESEELKQRVARLEKLLSVYALRQAEGVNSDAMLDGLRDASFDDPKLGDAMDTTESLLRNFKVRALNIFISELDTIRRQHSTLHRDAEAMGRELHQYFAVTSLGVDTTSVRLARYIPIEVYLADGDDFKEAPNVLMKALQTFYEAAGFTTADEMPPVSGSFWQKLFAKTKEPAFQEEVAERLAKMERALELKVIDQPQAMVDQTLFHGVSEFVKELQGFDNVAVQLGSVLLVKTTDTHGKSDLAVRNLSQPELIHLLNNPHLLRKPAKILDTLSQCEEVESEKRKQLAAGVIEIRTDGFRPPP